MKNETKQENRECCQNCYFETPEGFEFCQNAQCPNCHTEVKEDKCKLCCKDCQNSKSNWGHWCHGKFHPHISTPPISQREEIHGEKCKCLTCDTFYNKWACDCGKIHPNEIAKCPKSTLSTDWEEEFEETCPLAFAGREWAKNFITSHTQKVRQEERSLIRQRIEKLKEYEEEYEDGVTSEPRLNKSEVLSALSQEE